MNRREGDRSKHREGKDESPCSQVAQTPPVIPGQEPRKPAKPSRCGYGYRLKALAEIRNSLLPFATGDPTDKSSASSSTASECGSGQYADSGANGLDCNAQYGSAREEEQSSHAGKFPGAKSIDFVSTESKSNTFSSSGNQKQDKINGLTRSNLGLANLKPLRKGNVQESCNWELPQRLSENSSSSARSDSPGISITGLQHQILPDQPRLVSGNGGHVSENTCHGHLQLTRQQSPGFPAGDLPPPPPPRIGVGNSAQHFFKRTSPIPHSTGQQIINSSTSSPQRGASPVSSGRSPVVQLTVAQAKQQLVHQLKNLTIYSNNASSTLADLPPPYASTAMYSSPPPSYKSSSSGKQSPTPTISSSEYSSVPPVSQKKCLPTSFTPPPSTNSTQAQQAFSFPVTSSSYPCASSTTVLTTVARPSSLQAWSARQAKSQSPVIMQSVKSTQVQKPVLQTAVAPTLPSNTCATHSVTFIQPSPASNQLPACVAYGRSQIGHMLYPSVPGVPNYSSNLQNAVVDASTQLSPSSSPTPDLYHTSITSSFYPANLNAPSSHSMFQQVQISTSYNTPFSSSVLSPTTQVPPPPYTTSAHQPTGMAVPPPSYSSVNSESPAAISASHIHPKQKQKVQPDPPVVHNQPTTAVPTTDPPSYATSIAALAAQKAAVSVLNNNLPVVCCVADNHLAAASTSTKTTTTDNETNSHMTMCNLVNTVESICASQVMSDTNSNLRANHDVQGEPLSYMLHSPLQRKPSPVSMDTGSSASRSESPVSRGLSQSPVSSMSTTSTSSPSVQSDLTQDTKKTSSYKITHQSPIPPRKVLSKEKEDERQESKVKNYSPAAYKFFMEQHVENILKFQQQRQHRRQQLETEMVKVGLSDEAQHQMRKMLHQKESNYIRLKRAKMDKAMFTKIKTIGLGAFGEVALVQKVDTKLLYAMKTLRKSDVLKRNQVAHVKAERDILAEADNEWVVKLYYSFQDQENLYFVMDYIPGGDLMSLLIKFGVFQEPLAQFYIGELVLAVESVHKMGFIHRDIKPDNILIDRDGHIKLTDFGLCTGFRWTHNSKYYQSNGEHGRQDSTDSEEKWSNKCHCKSSSNLKPLERRRRREHQRCLAHSLVGTPNYIAPEVLMRLGYTQLCDWWSVGVILYEMLVGQPPFLASTPAETQYKVINWETTLHIPKAANLSKEATDLTLKLCCGPDKRLGRTGADNIKKHPFFNSIDFEGGLRKQPAPYLPTIRYPTDTSNFDPIDVDKLKNSNSGSSDESRSEDGCDNGKHSEHAFFEFTFRRFFDGGGQAYPVRISLDENDGQSSPVYV